MKAGLEHVLALHVKREGCDAILRAVVHSAPVPGIYESDKDKKRAVRHSCHPG